MSKWRRRDPNLFPAKYSEVVIAALSNNEQPTYFFSSASKAAAVSTLDNFRWWRMCLRTMGHMGHRAYPIEKGYVIATSIKPKLTGGFDIFVTVKSDPIKSFERLNSVLFAEIIEAAN